MILALPGRFSLTFFFFPVLVLHFVALWFILRGNLFYVLPCVILFLCFSVLLALRLPRLGKREIISAFRMFVRFALVWICLFPLPLGVCEGLRFVIVAFPGLFSYPFFLERSLEDIVSGVCLLRLEPSYCCSRRNRKRCKRAIRLLPPTIVLSLAV